MFDSCEEATNDFDWQKRLSRLSCGKRHFPYFGLSCHEDLVMEYQWTRHCTALPPLE